MQSEWKKQTWGKMTYWKLVNIHFIPNLNTVILRKATHTAIFHSLSKDSNDTDFQNNVASS